MAVQAQYPANLVLVNRAEAERNGKDIEMELPHTPLFEQSAVVFYSNGGNANPRKRGRGPATTVVGMPFQVAPQQQQQKFFSLQAQPAMQAALLTPASMLGLQSGTTPPLVSTGLRLAFDEQNQSQVHSEQPICPVSASLSEDLLAQINQQKDEYEQFLLAQKEQLRRALAERWQRHYRTLLAVAEESAGRRLHEKKAEIESAARRCAELESQLVRLRTESMAWQAKAMAEQATAVSLHAQLQQASAAAASAKGQAIEECCEESPVEDGESAYVDPFRTPGMPERPCFSCRRNPASFVLLPCRHLCLCFACDSASAAGESCPACGCFRKGSLQVSLC